MSTGSSRTIGAAPASSGFTSTGRIAPGHATLPIQREPSGCGASTRNPAASALRPSRRPRERLATLVTVSEHSQTSIDEASGGRAPRAASSVGQSGATPVCTATNRPSGDAIGSVKPSYWIDPSVRTPVRLRALCRARSDARSGGRMPPPTFSTVVTQPVAAIANVATASPRWTARPLKDSPARRPGAARAPRRRRRAGRRARPRPSGRDRSGCRARRCGRS